MKGSTFRLWAKLMRSQSDTVREDAMIAATAIEQQLIVVTRNIKDFKRFKVKLFNPFEDR
jgi:predicted nucleic acid-binding protein